MSVVQEQVLVETNAGENKNEFRIDKYKWTHADFLGKGAYGKVYKGQDVESNEVVAVKELDQKLLKTKKGRDDFKQESEILLQFQSENVVRLYIQEVSEDRAIIVMEMCGEGDLREYLNSKNKKLTEEEAVKIIRQLMKGFKEITDKGFIHRDIKPENALKKEEIFKVADFGFAKQIDIKDSNKKIKEFIGTPLYMSPQILKQIHYSAKSDIWSIGMMFYEMLFGYLPFPARDYYSYMNNVWKMTLKFPVDKPIHANTKDFLQKCLQKKEEDRIGWDTIFDHPMLKEDEDNSEMSKPLYEFDELAKKVITKIQTCAAKYSNIDQQLQTWFEDGKQYDKQEFFELLKKIDEDITIEQVDHIFIPIDISENQKIDIQEFKNMIINYDFRDINDQAGRLIYELHEVIKARRINLWEFFDKYDKDKGGSVDRREFDQLIKDFFPDLSEKDIQLLFDFFDINKDAHISFKEFFDTMQVHDKKKDRIDTLNEKIVSVFQKAGRFIKEYNIDIQEVQVSLDDSYSNVFNFQGFSKFLSIFDNTMNETEMRYAFSNPEFQVNYFSSEKLVSLENIIKVLENPMKISQNVREMAIQCQAKIEQLKQEKNLNNFGNKSITGEELQEAIFD